MLPSQCGELPAVLEGLLRCTALPGSPCIALHHWQAMLSSSKALSARHDARTHSNQDACCMLQASTVCSPTLCSNNNHPSPPPICRLLRLLATATRTKTMPNPPAPKASPACTHPPHPRPPSSSLKLTLTPRSSTPRIRPCTASARKSTTTAANLARFAAPQVTR